MKQKTALILIFSLVTAGMLKAQPSGYLGKKIIFGYNIGTNFSMFMQSDDKQVDYKLNALQNFTTEFVTSEKISIGVSYTYSILKNLRQQHYYDYDFFGRWESGIRTTKFNTKLHGVNLVIKKFSRNRGHIAPIGRYVKYGIGIITFQSYAAEDLYYYVDDYATNSYIPVFYSKGTKMDKRFFDIPLMIGYGRQYVVGNKILVDVGGSISITTGAIVNMFYYDTNNNRYNANIPSTYEYEVVRHNSNFSVFATHLVQLNIGIGFLAF